MISPKPIITQNVNRKAIKGRNSLFSVPLGHLNAEHMITTIVTNAVTKNNPDKKLKASKKCTAPMAHSSRFAKPWVPVLIITMGA